MSWSPRVWRTRTRVLTSEDHTLVMGVLNVTPDSFSDGGMFLEPGPAIAGGIAMAGMGADIVDVGGESTRPGSDPVGVEEEIRRVVPVVSALAERGLVVSIDTSKAAVAAAALAAGAEIVNDVTALGDPDMGGIVAEAGAGLVLMHMLGTPRTMQDDPRYDDVVAEVRGFLTERAAAAEAVGVARDRIAVDPGIGFGKTVGHNLELLAGVPALVETGYPVVIGASRKSFLTALLGPLDPEDRDAPTAAAHVVAIAGGAAAIRVHDVVVGLRTARVADAIVRLKEVGRHDDRP